MDLLSLLLIGILATSYPENYDKHGKPLVKMMERRLRDPYQKTYDNGLAEVAFELNALGLCLYPACILRQKYAFDVFFQENDIENVTQQAISWPYQQSMIDYDVDLHNESMRIIPKITHHVWITHPKKPKELFSIKEQISIVENTMQTFNQLPGWRHYLWTNDKSLLPETTQWAESIGIQVRELSELGHLYYDFEALL